MWPAAPAQFPTSALTLCYDSRANLALADLMQHSGQQRRGRSRSRRGEAAFGSGASCAAPCKCRAAAAAAAGHVELSECPLALVLCPACGHSNGTEIRRVHHDNVGLGRAAGCVLCLRSLRKGKHVAKRSLSLCCCAGPCA